MVSVRGNALIGPNLELRENCLIQIDDTGVIRDISFDNISADYSLPSSYIVVPGFVNMHTHVADAFIKDHTFGLSIEKAVGPEGLKHKQLKVSTQIEKSESIQNSLELLVKNGFTTFVDFREEGREGIRTLRKELKNFPIRGIILGRKITGEKISQIFEIADGLGFCDILSIANDSVLEIKSLKNKNPDKLVSIHAAETMDLISVSLTKYGVPDVKKICEYSIFDFIVHATYSNEDDIQSLMKNGVNVVCCPIANLYHGLKFPPIALILRNNVLLGLGTDNVLSCNPDPFRLMAFTLYSARSNYQNLEPKEILKAITVNAGNILKRKIGQISIGYSGDLLGINLGSPNTKYSKDVFTAITMRADIEDIGFQMFEGKIVKWKDLK